MVFVLKCKFAHIADCHLGSWSAHPKLREFSIRAFEKAIDICIKENIDFIIIAGDLFDNSIPAIDVLKRSFSKIRECVEHGIRIYAIAGSHDYSPSGKTMLSVLESAGLIKDIGFDGLKIKTAVDNGVFLAGIVGKRMSLEKNLFDELNSKIIEPKIADGSKFKIFVFHSALDEYKPPYLKEMKSIPFSMLPKGFDYYAAGHVHLTFADKNRHVFYPGELFPTSFDELEKYNPVFFIVNVEDGVMNVEQKSVKLFDVVLIEDDVTGKSIINIENEIIERIESLKMNGNLLLLKVGGVLDGRVSDIDFDKIYRKASEKGAIIIKKSVHVTTKDLEEINIKSFDNIEELEHELVKEHSDKIKTGFDSERVTFELMNILKEEKKEGETNADFESKILDNVKKVLEL